MEQELRRGDGLLGCLGLLLEAVHRLVPALEQLGALPQQQEGGERLGRRTLKGVERLARGVGADAGLVPEEPCDGGCTVQLARCRMKPDELHAGLDARDRRRGKIALPATGEPSDEPFLLHGEAQGRLVGCLNLRGVGRIEPQLQFECAPQCLTPAEHDELLPGLREQRKAAGPVGLRDGHFGARDIGRVEVHRLLERHNRAGVGHPGGAPGSLKLPLPTCRGCVGCAQMVDPLTPVRGEGAQEVCGGEVIERRITARSLCRRTQQRCSLCRTVCSVGRAQRFDEGRMFGGEGLTKSLSDACVRHVRHLVVWSVITRSRSRAKCNRRLPLPRGSNTR